MKKLVLLYFGLLLGREAVADFQAGLQAYDKGDFGVALKEWQPLAEGGEPRALLRLGLMKAYGNGGKVNVEEAEKLFLKASQSKANLNEAGKRGQTALTWAARKKNAVLVEALLAGGADINLGGEDQKTPLMVAADSGSLDMLSLLLKKGADPKKADKDLKTALHYAASGYSVESALPNMQALLAAGADPGAADKNGSTPMHIAVERGGVERIELLLSKGGKLDAVERHGWTPLMLLLDGSPREKTLDLVRFLVGKGAGVQLVDKTKKGPLHLLARHAGDETAVKLLSFLLEKGADVKGADDEGRTSLHLAVERLNDEATPLPFVQALLEKGADPNARDKYKETPMFFAIRPDLVDKAMPILDALVARGGNLNTANEKGLTPLHLSMVRPGEAGSAALIKFLLSKGADVNARSQDGRTPLHMLAEAREGAGMKVIGALLLENKADPNIQETIFGKTPLHMAAAKRNTDLVKVLLAAGARTDIKDNHKDLARNLAEENGAKELALLIRDSAPGVAIPVAPAGVLDKAGQQKRAEELFVYLGKIKDNDHDLIEKAYREIVERCPESDKVPEALWRLSNLYLYGLEKPALDKCVQALEKLLTAYPGYMNIDPLSQRREAMTPVQKRLVVCYEKLGDWGKVGDLYRPAFAKPELMAFSEYIACGVLFGKALERAGKNEEAIQVYEKTLNYSKEKGTSSSLSDRLVEYNLGACKDSLVRLKAGK